MGYQLPWSNLFYCFYCQQQAWDSDIAILFLLISWQETSSPKAYQQIRIYVKTTVAYVHLREWVSCSMLFQRQGKMFSGQTSSGKETLFKTMFSKQFWENHKGFMRVPKYQCILNYKIIKNLRKYKILNACINQYEVCE